MVEQREVEHQPESGRFVIVTDGEPAILAYEIRQAGNGTAVDFYHTYVPSAYRRQGLAEKLVRTGLAWARAEHYQVEASCWYVRKFLRS